MLYLRQSTARKVPIGPCVQLADGGTLLPSITWSTGEALLIKNDSATIVNIGTNVWSATLGGGLYNVSLTAGDTDTLGPLVIVAYDAAMRPARLDAMVVLANVWDSLCGSQRLNVNIDQIDGNDIANFLSDTTRLNADITAINSSDVTNFMSGTTGLNADVKKIDGSANAASNMSNAALGIVSGVVASGSTTTIVKTTLTEATNDHYNGRMLIFITGALAGQATTITDYAGASRDLTVAALTEAPAINDTFVIL